jgi:hypothetical protein
VTRRAQIVAGLAALGLVSGAWWWWQRAPRRSPYAGRAVSLTAVAPNVRLSLDLVSALPGEDAALIVHAFKPGTPLANVPTDWVTGLSISVMAGRPPVTDLTRTAAPSADPRSAVFAIVAPEAGARITATLRVGGRTFSAQTTAPGAPGDAATLARMRRRIEDARRGPK